MMAAFATSPSVADADGGDEQDEHERIRRRAQELQRLREDAAARELVRAELSQPRRRGCRGEAELGAPEPSEELRQRLTLERHGLALLTRFGALQCGCGRSEAGPFGVAPVTGETISGPATYRVERRANGVHTERLNALDAALLDALAAGESFADACAACGESECAQAAASLRVRASSQGLLAAIQL